MSARTSRWAGRALLVLLTASMVHEGVWLLRHHEAIRPMSAGDVAPPLALPRIDDRGQVVPGEVVTLEELRGKVVLLDFWATWCGPCIRSMPVLRELHRRFGDRGFEIVSINTDDPAKARTIADANDLGFPLVADPGGAANAYRVTMFPHIVVIDRAGVVRKVHRGFPGTSELRDELSTAVERLLAR